MCMLKNISYIVFSLSLVFSTMAEAHPRNKPHPPVMPSFTEAARMSNFSIPSVVHPRLFDSYEVGFGDPVKVNPRTAVLKQGLADLAHTNLNNVPLPVNYNNARNQYQGWLALLQTLRGESPLMQLELVNAFANKQPYTGKREQGMYAMDQWQDPASFFLQGGDCEDYAIAKYVSLRALGFHPERLRVVIGTHRKTGAYHANLAVLLNNDIIVLDNPDTLLKAHMDLKDFKPLYSFNENQIWFHWYQGETPPNFYTSRDVNKFNVTRR